MRHIRLIKGMKLGPKQLKRGQILQLDRASMDALVRDDRAYYCSPKGLRFPKPDHLKIVGDDEEE